jgi:TolA-binding protein
MARNYINAGAKARGEDLLKKIIAKYPNTKAAAKATVELEELKEE